MNEFNIPCFECANQLTVSGRDDVVCGVCGKKYTVIENTRYGIGGSASFQSLSCDESRIVIFYLENIPLNLLEKASNQHRLLSDSENKPAKLFDTTKDYYDCIFKRIQDVLGSERSELIQEEKDKINYNPRSQGFNLANLMMRIPDAFPYEKNNTTQFLDKQEQLAKSMTWLRHKIEHIVVRKWPIPSYVHKHYKSLPEEQSTVIFNAEYLRNVNNFVVDLYSIVMRIDNRNTLEVEYENVEQFRI